MTVRTHTISRLLAFAGIAFLFGISVTTASADDRHAGYYYPVPQTSEVYHARIAPLPNANRRMRIAFVTGVAAQQQHNPYAPTYHLFAKGEEAEKLILVSTGDGHYQTLYQLRALLATLTAVARSTPVFLDQAAPEDLTFLDLCSMLGVKLLTMTNGENVAHQFEIQ